MFERVERNPLVASERWRPTRCDDGRHRRCHDGRRAGHRRRDRRCSNASARREVSGAELRAAAVARAHAVNDPAQRGQRLGRRRRGPRGAVDEHAPFAGIPSVIKDNEDLTGYVTTQGSWAMPERPATACSPFVRSTCGSALLPIARTTMPEFGLTASTESLRFGATRNPWDVERSAGGSSGGSRRAARCGRRTDGARQRRRRLHPHPRRVLRARRAEAVAGPAGRLAGAREAPGGHRCAGGADPQRARHRALLRRGRAAPSQPRRCRGSVWCKGRLPPAPGRAGGRSPSKACR